MNQVKLLHLMDMVEDIKQLDQIIELHVKADDGDFAVNQYQSRKNKLIASFIDQLVSSVAVSERSFLTIKLVLDKFYPNLMQNKLSIASEDDLSLLESVLQ